MKLRNETSIDTNTTILTNLMLLKALYIFLKEHFFVKMQGNVTENICSLKCDMTYFLIVFMDDKGL